MATSVSLPDLDRLRPAGTKRSSKRDQIVNAFLKQEGHLSADDLVDMIKREDHRISRATVYRTLQWMVDRRHRPQGRFRRGPLPLRALLPPPAALSPHLQDLQPLVRVPQLGHRVAGRGSGGGPQVQRPPERGADLRHLRGLPGRPRRRSRGQQLGAAVRPRRACASPSPPSAAAASSTPGPRGWSRTRRGRHVFEKLAEEESRSPRTGSRRATRPCSSAIPQLESQPTFLFFKGAANGLFAEGTEQLRKPGVDEAEALRIGIRCERGSHKFFKRYGERFEDSEGKQIFLEFAEEEREHLELLIREYRALITRRHAGKRARQPAAAPRPRPAAARPVRPRDRPAPAHDRLRRPVQSDGARAAGARRRRAGVRGDRPRHGGRPRRGGGGRPRPRPDLRAAASRSPRCGPAATSTCSATGSTATSPPSPRSSASSAPAASSACRRSARRWPGPVRRSTWTAARRRCSRARAPRSAGPTSPGCSSPPDRPRRCRTPSIAGSPRAVRRYVPRSGVSPEAVVAIIHDAGGLASLAHPGVTRRDECLEPLGRRRARRDRGVSLRSQSRRPGALPRAGRAPSACS